jgi:hypothetical protein
MLIVVISIRGPLFEAHHEEAGHEPMASSPFVSIDDILNIDTGISGGCGKSDI